MDLIPVWKMCQRFLAPASSGVSITWAEMGMPPCLLGEDAGDLAAALATEMEIAPVPARSPAQS